MLRYYQVRKEAPGRFVVWNCCEPSDQHPVAQYKTKAAAVTVARLMATAYGTCDYVDHTKDVVAWRGNL